MTETKILPNMEYRFSIQIVGEESGLNWTGDFLYKRPTIGQRAQIDALRARLCGDLATLDPSIIDMNLMIAHLRFTLHEYPDWWAEADHGNSLYDTNVVLAVYDKIIEFERSWRENIHGKITSNTVSLSSGIESTETKETDSSPRGEYSRDKIG